MAAEIVWAKGGEAVVVALREEAITLKSTIPSPPGSRIEGTLAEGEAAAVRVKIHSSKRQEDGSFVLEGRVLDLTRGLRERLGA
ncbi:MAG TPA: hypothetical protein VGI39_01135 [Polyangiaceae bacterium]|jgi:hypothetical protein